MFYNLIFLCQYNPLKFIITDQDGFSREFNHEISNFFQSYLLFPV